MKYKDVEVESIGLVSYLGEEFKEKDWKSNQKYFRRNINGYSFNCGIECPIDDMICVQINRVTGTEKEDIDTIVKACGELKKYVNNTFINLYLNDFLEEGNSIDLTIEEFEELYK